MAELKEPAKTPPAAAAPAYTVLLLAAQRRGDDRLSALTGARHKCLIDLHGRPMIAWVLDTLLAAPMVRQVLISIEDASVLAGVSEVAAARVQVITSADNLYASVERALTGAPGNCPALITTADNPLLSVEMLTHFCSELERRQADAAATMTRAELMRAKYPEGQRRFYAFRDDEYSNCNLYALANARALHAAKIFQHGGQFRKKIIRTLRAFGLFNVILYKLRALTLNDLAERLSHSFGLRLTFITMPFPEAPIDVDNERTLKIARAIIGQRLQETS
ncbi:MAG: nucleotidyltransferase family protein [Gammaproteobacteria bacterium]|nr:nucleotidyltransferase family protein [Gammaproteobacteria bacterium]